ncbi:hypothetical protein [Reinekea blandensis]|uniref:Histone acetyltransferase HPA2/related acetyltransferase n=1 Tax=Reinekea blandensis MED297 TaxID=314283 RepID=A4BJC6_9GAMM|nr:hypothetical protein [Reinekea blandensis]EAR07784.1 Histone acetyltransferase HPA2/related acetyltransferase [Reinekea sp. MED297] [Reinekea blandensis MED297]
MTEPTSDTPSETGVIRLDSADGFAQHSCEVLANALRTINIVSTDLERTWLGHTEVVDALKRAVIKNRRVHVRILLTEPGDAIAQKHPLIPLIKRLSRMEARVIEDDILDKVPLKHTFLTVDRSRVVLRQTQDEFIGFAHYDDRPTVSQLQDTFDQYWRYSRQHPDLRFVNI